MIKWWKILFFEEVKNTECENLESIECQSIYEAV